MKNQRFSIINRLKSFKHAFNGLKILIKEEHNSRIHLTATILVVTAGILFEISKFEWITITFAVGIVFIVEIINSSIENVADFVSPDKNEMIKKIKDLSASAVLISALIALIIGLIIFIPKIMSL